MDKVDKAKRVIALDAQISQLNNILSLMANDALHLSEVSISVLNAGAYLPKQKLFNKLKELRDELQAELDSL